jgi:glycosyltransferase involved in cell wall biosynthesis
VVRQTHADWELVLVDDGSTDGSRRIVERYAESRPERVRCVSHPGRARRGVAAARNLGLAAATGEYIAFLDADDVYLPDALAARLAILEREPRVGMVVEPNVFWHSWTGRAGRRRSDFRSRVPSKQGVIEPRVLFRLLLGQVSPIGTCSTLIRRPLVDAVGGFDAEFRRVFEDQAFFLKLALAAPSWVDHATRSRYRQHPDSTCANASRSGTLAGEREVFLRWLRELVRTSGLPHARYLGLFLKVKSWAYRYPILWRLRITVLIRKGLDLTAAVAAAAGATL